MKRPSVAALERAIAAETQIWVLDHGFIQILDYMGDDEAIVNAARTSYGAGTKQLRENKALLDYLPSRCARSNSSFTCRSSSRANG
jgi:thymidylate synthase (FAD)